MPNRRRRRLFALSLPLCLLAAGASLAGCGGAGTTLGGPQATLNTPRIDQAGSGGGAPRSASEAAAKAAAAPQTRLGLFVAAGGGGGGGRGAEEFAPDYEHVWATVHKVELLDQAEQATAVFSDEAGRALDLKSLAGGPGSDGRAALLTAAPLASAGKAAHQRVRVTLGKSLLLFGPGDSTAKSVAIGAPAALDAQGYPTVTFSLARARNLGTGKEDLVVSFGALSVREDKAVVTLRENEDAARRLSDAARQEPATFTGMVSGLNGDAPALSFTVTGADGAPVAVQTLPQTAVFNADAKGNPAVTDGARVSVRGTLDPATKKVVARSVRVEGAESAEAAGVTRVVGTLSRADRGASTLILEPRQVSGAAGAAAPTQAAVTVVLGEGAVLRSRGGLLLSADEFWAAVDGKSAPRDLLVEVEGELDPAVGTLTARRARLESASPNVAHEVVLSGAASGIDAAGRTLTLTGPFVEWDGIAAPAAREGGKGVPVVVTAATQCADAEGKYLASASLLSAAGELDKVVRVTGLYADGKVTATKIELRPAPPKPVKEEKPAADKATGDKPAEGGPTGKPAPGAPPPAGPAAGEKAPDDKSKPAEEKPAP